MLEDLMSQMKNMMVASQQKLDELIITIEKGGITVKCTGNKKITDITISDSLMQEGDKEQIEDLLVAAISEALETAEFKSKSAVNDIAGGLIPGGFGDLF